MGSVENFATANFSSSKAKLPVFDINLALKNIKNKLSEVSTISSIYQLIVGNPNVLKILSDLGISLEINIKNLENLSSNHLIDTRDVAIGIISHLSPSLKSKVDIKSVQEACAFHDFGKVLIPEKIINKASSLDEHEQKIMSYHAQLGYELLKKSHLSAKTLDLIKNHHSISSDINLQILSMADMYSALREERIYKKSMSKTQALAIIYKEVQKSRFHLGVFKALSEHVAPQKVVLFNPQRQVVNF